MLKQLCLSLIAIALFASCNNNSNASSGDAEDSQEVHASQSDAPLKTVSAQFDNLEQPASEFVNSIVADYLKIETALVNENETDAASAAKALNATLHSFDKSHFTIDQKKEYDKVEGDLSKLSELIQNGGMEEQRPAFAEISRSIHQLITDFKTGGTLYYAFCPMYEGGAYWITDKQNIANPYYGEKMLTCGEIQEAIQ